MFLATGRPHQHRLTAIVRVLLLVCLIYPSIKLFGASGAAGVVLLACTIVLCMQLLLLQKSIGLEFSKYLLAWIPGILLGVLVLLPVVIFKIIGLESVVWNLSSEVVLCLTAWGIWLFSNRSKLSYKNKTIGKLLRI